MNTLNDGGNVAGNYESNSADDLPGEEMPNEEAREEAPEEEEIEDRPLEELRTVGLPSVGISPAANDASGGFNQRVIHVRYAITDNSLRTSPNLPEAKHLRIKLPSALVQWCGGVWVAVSGEDVYVDVFARNDQVGRNGRKAGDVWRWIKVKPNGEFAMGISRPYTKSMSDGVLVRDYDTAAFKLTVPFLSVADAADSVAVAAATHRPMST
jgi:hypothetical protein